MASVDSGVDTENESNDSSLTAESAKTEPNQQQSSYKQQVGTQTEPPSTLFEPPVIACPLFYGIERFLFNSERTDSLPQFPISFCRIRSKYPTFRFDSEGKAYYPAEVHRNKITRHCNERSHITRFLTINAIARVNAEKKLRMAANFNNVEAVKRLLNDGVNPRSGDKKKRTALHISACKGYSEIVSLLLANGADPHQKDIVGNTALHVAAYTNHFTVILLLLQATASNLNALDESGCNVFRVVQTRMRSLLKDINSLASDQPTKVLEECLKILDVILKHCNEKAEAELIVGFSNNLSLKHAADDDENTIQDAMYSLSELTLQKKV